MGSLLLNNLHVLAFSCSAGVGRTGVFIALDHLTQHINDHDFVDIYGLVAELRSERMCMVQNLVSYLTVQAVSAPKFLQRRVLVAVIWVGVGVYSVCKADPLLSHIIIQGRRRGLGEGTEPTRPRHPSARD